MYTCDKFFPVVSVVILDKIGMRTATGLLDACANERSYHSNQFGSY